MEVAPKRQKPQPIPDGQIWFKGVVTNTIPSTQSMGEGEYVSVIDGDGLLWIFSLTWENPQPLNTPSVE
jgi:hypothetical protein